EDRLIEIAELDDRLAVHAGDDVARLQAGALRRRVGKYFADDRLDERADADLAGGTEIGLFAFRRHGGDVALAVAQVFDAQRGAGMDRDDEAEIVEVFDWIAVDGEDAVADLKAGNRRGTLGDDFAEDRR